MECHIEYSLFNNPVKIIIADFVNSNGDQSHAVQIVLSTLTMKNSATRSERMKMAHTKPRRASTTSCTLSILPTQNRSRPVPRTGFLAAILPFDLSTPE